MQDNRGIFPFVALVFTSENTVFLMGVYRTVPTTGWGGGCGFGVARILDHKQGYFQIP
jgi:hypothetical protein